MEKKLADLICAVLCALYLGVLLIVATGYQGSIRAILGSETIAAWAGAMGTILAVASGFALARKQSRDQAALVIAAERRAIAAKLRSAAMLIKHVHTYLEGVLQHMAKTPDPRNYARVALEGGFFTAEAFKALSGFDVGGIPVPSAIDAITSARGMVGLIEQKMKSFAFVESSDVQMAELQRLCRAISAHFVSVASLATYFEPDWPSPPDFYVDSSIANPEFPTRV